MSLTAAGEPRVAYALRALRHRNFRLFAAGQSISLIGTWMQQVAVGWLVYRLTSSPLLLGLVGFVAQGPAFLLAPLAGVLADRYPKRRIVLTTQLVMMIQALLLGALVLAGQVTILWIVLLMSVLGAATAFDIPARQAFLIEMVQDRQDLPNAIALNSSMFNVARLIGPAIAGLAIGLVGEGWVILLNGASYVAVLASLSLMRVDRPHGRAQPGRMLGHLAEGFRYAFGFPPIRLVLTHVAIVSLFAVPFTVLLPLVAGETLRGGPETLGFLMSAIGLGALTGAVYLAGRSSVRGLGRVIAVAAVLFGAGLMALSLSRVLWLSVLCLGVAGFGMMAQIASSNTVLQTIVDDDKRGRVMSMFTMAFVGMAPIGSLLAGLVAERIGANATIGLGGLVSGAAGVFFALRLPLLRQHVRPIYERLGILPEVARGLQAATQPTTPEPRGRG
ncbi:MAG: MFS transporter [Gemmatimonadetes bacterium]|nr:MFS transporter [Gemmatimonadota bacterium]